ncbi:MAG TPA: ABC transporter substrate-binding protein [Thermomicrobiales bacterium]|nr:ABC transporter substrate-binding protein [Thermomicrobiales bacterium]
MTKRSMELNRRNFARMAGATPFAAALGTPLALSYSAQVAAAQDDMLEQVVVALGADPLTMMPNSIVDWTTDIQLAHMFDRAMNYDPEQNYEVGPWLCELTNIDDLTWELTLVSPDITFHSGNPLTANDFKYAIEWAQDPANESHYLERWEQFEEVTIVDNQTFRIKTTDPFPLIAQRMVELYPVDSALIEEIGIEEYIENPSGTGPFTFQEWVRGEYLRLERNPDYWHNEVQVQEVEFRFMPEFSSRLAALLAGEVQIVKDIPVDSIPNVEDSENARVEEIPSSRVNYVALVNNREDSVFTDVRLRRAVNHGVDVQAIIDGVFQGHATRMAGALSNLNPEVNAEIEPYPYDPELARELIREAGYEPGELTVTMDAPQGRYPMDTDAAQAIAASLTDTGINVEVQYNEWGTHLDKIVNRQTGDMFYLGWGPALDAYGTLVFLFIGDSTYSSYSNDEVTPLIEEAMVTVDEERRQELWNEVQQIVYDDAGWLFLWQQHDIYGVTNDVAWEPRPDEFMWMGQAEPREA